MKELVLFSLKRRFLNKTNKMLMIMLLILFLLGFYMDKIVDLFVDQNPIVKIRLENVDEDLFLMNSPFEVEVNPEAPILIKLDESGFNVESENVLSEIEQIQIESLIYPYYQQSLPIEIQETLLMYRHPEIIYHSQQTQNVQQKHDNLFMVITAMYFMMLGFAGMLASEVVAEKTSNILEMIGTSVSLKTHYYSKIVIGWLSILIQFSMMGILALVGLISRYFLDNGSGLLSFLNQLELISTTKETFSELIRALLTNYQSLIDLGLSLLFLFIGILVVQLLLVVITTRVNTIEEAGALQNPFYMGLLFLYYGALLLNNPQSMSEGWGYTLSFVPIFSMIFMPSRLMLIPITAFEISVALFINILFLVIVIIKGEKIYVKQVLNSVYKPKVKKKRNKVYKVVKKKFEVACEKRSTNN